MKLFNFDSVKNIERIAISDRRLLQKLAGYGVSSEILSLFKVFLSNRKQRVVVEEEMLEWSDVLSLSHKALSLEHFFS